MLWCDNDTCFRPAAVVLSTKLKTLHCFCIFLLKCLVVNWKVRTFALAFEVCGLFRRFSERLGIEFFERFTWQTVVVQEAFSLSCCLCFTDTGKGYEEQCTVIPLYWWMTFIRCTIDYLFYRKLTLDAGLYRFIPVRQHAFAIIYYL